MFKLKNDEFLRKSYLTCGAIAYTIGMLVILAVLLLYIGVLRVEFNIFTFLILPNFISKAFLLVWTMYYVTTSIYGRDINQFAKSLVCLTIANMIVIAVDESTKFYYFAQSVTGIMYTVFMCMLVFQRRYAVDAKKHATMGYVVNIFLYLTGAVQLFVLAISLLDKYDVYQVIMIGVFNLMSVGCVFGVGLIEKNYRIVINHATAGNSKN